MKWFKYGCFGCLGVLAVTIVVAAVIGGMVLQRARSMKPEPQILTRDLPAYLESPDTGGVPPGALAADMPGSAQPTRTAPTGRVVLDLSNGEFKVDPGAPGKPVRVEASYDHEHYALEERFDREEQGDWSYRVTFRRTSPSSFLTSLSELFTGGKPRVHVLLPVDVPMDLEIKTSQGGAHAELGGLWLRSADLEFAMGGVDLGFRKPLKEPVDRLSIRGSMGGGSFRSLGNASPRQLEVDFSMGGMDLDLSGRWLADARISISSSMGGGAVRLPRDVVIEGLGASHRGAQPGPGEILPTLTFSASKNMGELTIVD